jgi:hypothetical protein
MRMRTRSLIFTYTQTLAHSHTQKHTFFQALGCCVDKCRTMASVLNILKTFLLLRRLCPVRSSTLSPFALALVPKASQNMHAAEVTMCPGERGIEKEKRDRD